MTSQFSPKVSQILAFSREEAARLSSNSVGPEHLLLGLLRDNSGAIPGILKQLNVDGNTIKTEIERSLDATAMDANAIVADPTLNEKASNILRLSVLEARMQRSQMVEAEHLLLALLHDQADNKAKQVFSHHDVGYPEALNAYRSQLTTHTTSGIDLADEEEDEAPAGKASGTQGARGTATAQQKPGNQTPVLDKFSTDLTRAATEGKLDPMVGREKELMRVVEILGRRKKNNPVLIGEPGVGKSAIVEGLAAMIAARRVSPILFGKRVLSLDMTGIVAGTKYRGQFEERMKALVKELEQHDDIIVFIDEIHSMMGAGDSSGAMDAANILKPALARGVIQCIGATTLDEYRNSIEKDGALERRFQKVIVEQTTAAETHNILLNLRDRYEQHHHVTYSDDILAQCVKLAERYITDRSFPDKAIDIMDEVGSHVHLQHASVPPELEQLQKRVAEVTAQKDQAVKEQNFEQAAKCRDEQTQLEEELQRLQDQWQKGDASERVAVTDDDVAQVVSRMTGVPVQRMAESENARLRALAPSLKGKIIAQDQAIDKMVKAIQRNRVGLRAPGHPIGVFMFLGPTGVGKTYLAKKLAEEMFGSSDALIRIDMSEYTEAFNTSRLIGAPPGYVGYGEGGQLTERVRRKPYSIVLLDEIEKAHGNVFNLLLQVLDEGRLTDGNGRMVDFRNTIIIMTSNAGTRQLKDFGRGIGFNAGGKMGLASSETDRQYARSIIQKSLAKQFAPEFLNRLDEIITFDQLDLSAIMRIIDIELDDLYKRVADLGYDMRLTPEAKEMVAKKGYDVQFGARPLKRAIQNYIEDGLCEQLMSDSLKAGDTIKIGKAEGKDELVFAIEHPDKQLASSEKEATALPSAGETAASEQQNTEQDNK